MKKVISAILFLFLLIIPFISTFAEEVQSAPGVLTSISFKNASISPEFKTDAYQYGLTLEDTSVTPSLESYSFSNEDDSQTKLFVNYNTDETGRQSGIIVTVRNFGEITASYTFDYLNLPPVKPTDNTALMSVSFNMGEIVPKISHDRSEYRVFIPSDLTVLKIYPVTEDTNAVCSGATEITLQPGQETEHHLYVTASNGEKRVYVFKIKRVGKTVAEVEEEMKKSDYESFLSKASYYRNPELYVAAAATVSGAALSVAAVRIVVKKKKSASKEGQSK